MSRNRCCPICGSECESCPSDHKIASCFKLTLALSDVTDGCDPCLRVDSNHAGGIAYTFIQDAAAPSGEDATIIVDNRSFSIGETPCAFGGVKDMANGVGTPVEYLVDEVTGMIGCSETQYADQSQKLYAAIETLAIGHPLNPYPSAPAALISLGVTYTGFVYIEPYIDLAGYHGSYSGPITINIFCGVCPLEDLCTLDSDGSVVVTNDNVSILGYDATKCYRDLFPLMTGGTVTITRSDKPCFPVYCFAVFRSTWHSEVDSWSTPVFYEYRLLRDDQPSDWHFSSEYCTAEYLQKLSNVAYEKGSSAAVCSDYSYTIPSAPTLSTQCVICPAHCGCGDEFSALCCCEDLFVRLKIIDSLGEVGEFFVDVKVTRLSNLCAWAGTYDLAELSGTPLLGVDVTCSEDGKWQVGATAIEIGIVTVAHVSEENAADACPNNEMTWTRTDNATSRYQVEVISVGCDCPVDCSDCPIQYGFVVKQADSDYYKLLEARRDEFAEDCHWSNYASGGTASNWEVDIIANTDESTTGFCVYDILFTDNNHDPAEVWTFRATADRRCPHQFAFAQIAKSDPGMADLEIFFFGPVQTFGSTSGDCADTLSFGMTGTTSGTYDTIGDITRSNDAHLWSSGLTITNRSVTMQVQEWMESTFVQILSGITVIGTYTFKRPKNIYTPICPGGWTGGWYLTGNSVDASTPILSLGL